MHGLILLSSLSKSMTFNLAEACNGTLIKFYARKFDQLYTTIEMRAND